MKLTILIINLPIVFKKIEQNNNLKIRYIAWSTGSKHAISKSK